MLDLPDTGVSCRACGAKFARPHANKWGLCANCHYSARRQCDRELDDEGVASWLASQVLTKGKRLKEGKDPRRCECISFTGFNLGNRGFQCGSIANYVRDGRPVCHAHIRSPKVTFVDEYAPDPWMTYRGMLLSLAELHAPFRDILADVLQETEK